MSSKVNPFHDLYVGESVGPEKFVNLFSDVIVEHAHALFQPGNVVLKGLPGTGKSMLLNLLKPSVRIAYQKANVPFPVPKEFGKFIGAGINLLRSGIKDIGHWPIKNNDEKKLLPFYFGDFLNYWVIEDILQSLKDLNQNERLRLELGIDYSKTKLKIFASSISKNSCWNNYFDKITTFENFLEFIQKRIGQYRSLLSLNTLEISPVINNTKTVIGEPISIVVDELKQANIVGKETQFFIRIDQYEELVWLDEYFGLEDIGSTFQTVIHKLLGTRDSRVSYRIGTRHFAWQEEKQMFGTSARLEKKRNYSSISIDSVLKREENRRTWVFPRFAEDIFKRRIALSPYNTNESINSEFLFVFGHEKTPAQRAKEYVPNSKKRNKIIRVETNWPKHWVSFLYELAEKDPLAAKFAEAWCRQKGKQSIMSKKHLGDPYPWETKKWWMKERNEQALIQIASRNQQQLLWYGSNNIIALSGGNILAFLSLCQHIWDVWLRDNMNDDTNDYQLPSIDPKIQSIGIREASRDWFKDISNESGGKERQRFIRFIGELFYKNLVEDKAMSNPGHYGFSLTLEDLESNKKVYDFLKDASDYGDLYDSQHTSKMPDKKTRIKWYINQILSPNFKVPCSHIKEPIYIKPSVILNWLEMSTQDQINSKSEESSQLELPL